MKLQVSINTFATFAVRACKDLIFLDFIVQLAEFDLVEFNNAVESVLQTLQGILMVHGHHRLVELGLGSALEHLVSQITCK